MNKDETRRVSIYIDGNAADATIKQLTATSRTLRNELANLAPSTDAFVQKSKDLQAVNTRLKEVKADVDGVKQSMGGFFDDFKKGFEEVERIAEGVTIGTLISRGVRTAIDSIRELFDNAEKSFQDHELAEASLANKIRATGDISGETTKKLKKYQEALEAQTGIDETVVAKGEDILLTFTNIRGKIYDQALPALLSYTAAMNKGRVTMEGVTSAGDLMGKMLDDVTRAKRSARAMGITLTEQELKEIDTRRKANDVMGAQQVLIDAVNNRYGNLSQTIGDTATGKLQKLDTAWDAVSRRIGEFMTNAKASLAEFFLPLVKSLGDTKSKAEELSEEFGRQKDSVDALDKSTVPLLDKYDQLKSKGHLNNIEQQELKKVIGQIADAIPSAVSQWDNLGNAIAINTTKAREFIKEEKALLAFKNKDAIDATKKELDDLAKRQAVLTGTLNRGTVSDSGGGLASAYIRNLSSDEIRDMRKQLQDLANQIKDKQTLLSALQGGSLDALDPNKPDIVKPQGGLTQVEIDRAKKKLQEYQTQLQEARKAIDELIAHSTKGTVNSLDQELKVIQDKYDAIIKKLQDLNKNPLASKADKAANNKLIGDARKAEGLETEGARDDFNYKYFEKGINDDASRQSDKAKQDAQAGLIGKEQLAQKEYEIEQKRLQDLYNLQVVFGVETVNTEKLNADNEIRQKQRVYETAMKLLRVQLEEEKDFARAKEQIETAKQQLVTTTFGVVNQIFGKNKELLLAELALEKIIAIGKIEANEGVEIAGYWAKYALVPGGEAIAAGLSAAAVTRANLSIAQIIISGIGQAVGDLSSSGNKGHGKYEDGGYSAINYNNPAGWVKRPTLFANSSSGRPFVAGEGNKTEYIISSAQLKDPMVANFAGMLEANRMSRHFEYGGYSAQGAGSGPQGGPGGYHSSAELAEVKMHLAAVSALLNKEVHRRVIISRRVWDTEDAKVVDIKNNANA